MKVHKLQDCQYWYDRAFRCWFAARFDCEGNQVGECVDAYTKAEIVQLIERGRCQTTIPFLLHRYAT